jgi:hypothetical protein
MLSYRERRKIMEEQRLRKRPENPPQQENSRLWKFANAPITLWMLSTIAIGAITATITQYQNCARDFEINSVQFLKLSDELSGRNQLLYRRLSETSTEEDYDKQIDLFLSGENYFVYSDFRGKTITEISLARTLLARKLHPKWIAKNLRVYEIEIQKTETEWRLLSAQGTITDNVPAIQVETEPRQGSRYGKAPPSPYIWGIQSRGFGPGSQDFYFRFLRESAFKTFISYKFPDAYTDKGQYWDTPNSCSIGRSWASLLGF